VAEFLGIIPARYASTRFPGKPLAMLGGKPMIQWVYEGASSLFDHLVVATDDKRIYDAVAAFGGLVQMTSSEHKSGTDRCAEAADLYEQQAGLSFSHVVNIQGDEPLIQAEQLQTLMECIQTPGTGIATLIRPLEAELELKNPNVVKVVVDQSFRALYFSRAPIPFVRRSSEERLPDKIPFYSHIGLYAFRREILEEVVKLPPSALELAESLEQLRWMENGITIRTAVTHLPSLGVDTPEDLELIRKQRSF
jgi:3-deoxy-manno-octulosonate cytidylyltransferase (CMP-KDO synthetase)